MNAFSLHWISVWIPLFKWLFLLFSHQTQQCLNHCVICFDGDQEVSIKVEIIVKCLLFMNFLLFIIFYWIFYYILYKCFSKVHEWKDWGENSMNNFLLIYIMLNHLRLFWKSVVFFHLDNFILLGGFFRMGKYKDNCFALQLICLSCLFRCSIYFLQLNLGSMCKIVGAMYLQTQSEIILSI